MMDGTARATDPRGASAFRRIGYAVLPGDAFSYVLHLRLREWPIVAGHCLFGYLLAVAEVPGALSRLPIALLGVACFVALLNGGTLAINSAFDRDLGDIGYLDDPPPPPAHLFAFGLVLMGVGLLVSALVLPAAFTAIFAVCLAMSVLYSVPPFRWKAVAGLDLGINAVGFGVLTPLAGWTLAGAVPLLWSMLVIVGFGPLFAALYPLTQLYQLEEDRARGDRTFALVLGVGRSLVFSVAMTVVGLGLMAAGLGLGFGPGAALWIVLPLGVWLVLLLRWLRRYPTMSPADHKRGMYRALLAWALTNAAVLLGAILPRWRS